MKQAEILRQLLKEVEKLLNRNITENGECQLSLIKERYGENACLVPALSFSPSFFITRHITKVPVGRKVSRQ